MTWKIEKWFYEVFPGEDKIYSEYRNLNQRELIIVACAVLDIALAELISMRVSDFPKEYEEFLGLNGDGRAPVSSFGARIQLSLLLGIITIRDASILRTLKNLRNIFAHKVNVEIYQGDALKCIITLYENYKLLLKDLSSKELLSYSEDGLAEIQYYLDKIPEAAEGLVLSIFCTYHAYFHKLHEKIKRINVNCWE